MIADIFAGFDKAQPPINGRRRREPPTEANTGAPNRWWKTSPIRHALAREGSLCAVLNEARPVKIAEALCRIDCDRSLFARSLGRRGGLRMTSVAV
jgi:hypothetical protein